MYVQTYTTTHTHTGKTEILKHLDGQGHQVLDLEGLAEHRGSVLGGWETPQPPQKLFESHLNIKIQNFDVSRPVWVEDEAMTIGKLHVPKFLYEAVLNGARFDIALPLHEVALPPSRSTRLPSLLY
jgi:tRNA 2-selenouridine synthase